MTIHLPKNVESSINAAVLSGHFASLDDAMTEAAHLLLQKLNQGQARADKPAVSQEPSAEDRKPVWERILEKMEAVPDEVFDRIPADSSAQLDHYLYGTPKRPTA
jgi:Arc/MetJ-type ribon-helix-helix transcriptional regulator